MASSLKMSLSDHSDDAPELARATRKTRFMPKPSCVPASFESQSLVSSSSESHSKKSMGFSIDVMRSQSDRRRTSRGILTRADSKDVSRSCLIAGDGDFGVVTHREPEEGKRTATGWWLKRKKERELNGEMFTLMSSCGNTAWSLAPLFAAERKGGDI